jgi:hypothetical protein
MSTMQLLMVLAVVGIVVGVAISFVRRGVPLSSDPQDLNYRFTSEDELDGEGSSNT